MVEPGLLQLLGERVVDYEFGLLLLPGRHDQLFICVDNTFCDGSH
jgi:hypothetical protein